MANRYWVGGTGNWSDDDNHWSDSSGGTPANGNLPTSSDNVYFDANSGSGLMTFDSNANCADMDWTNSSLDGFTHTAADPGYDLSIYGSLTLKSGMTHTMGYLQIYFKATTAGHTIRTNGNALTGSLSSHFILDGVGGSWKLMDNLDIGGARINFLNGEFDTNNKVVNGGMDSQTNNARILKSGKSTWNCTFWVIRATNMIADLSRSTITIQNVGGGYFYGGGFTYKEVVFNNTSNTEISDNNTIGTLRFTQSVSYPHGAKFVSGSTQTIGNLVATGSSSYPFTLTATSTGAFALSKASGIVDCDYLIISKSTVTGGAVWFAGSHSTDSGSNTGWIFRDVGPITNQVYALPAFKV